MCCHSATERLTPRATMYHSAPYFYEMKVYIIKMIYHSCFHKVINNTFEFTTRVPLLYRNETGYLLHGQLHIESGSLVPITSRLSIRLGTKFTSATYVAFH